LLYVITNALLEAISADLFVEMAYCLSKVNECLFWVLCSCQIVITHHRQPRYFLPLQFVRHEA